MVNRYISAGLVTSYSMGDFRMTGHPHHHLVHCCGIQYPSDTVSSHSGSVNATVSHFDALMDAEISSI